MDATVPEDDAGRPIRTHVRAYLSDKSSVIVFLAALLAFAGITVSGVGTSAAADPSADDWYRLRVCESGNNYAIKTGNGYYGAYQFDLCTWGSVGGSGYPNQASPETQDALALRLWQQRGWGPWACARILGLTGSPSDSPPPPPPAPTIGSLDVVAVTGGSATVAGWALDPNSPGTSIQAHIYVNGAGYAFVSDGGRPDVNAVLGVSGGHGFSVTVPLQWGSNNVCAYSIGVASGNNTLLGCRTVQYFVPVGSFDLAAATGSAASVAGWAFDPGAPGQSISVDVYVNGAGVRLAANQPRADVNAVMGVPGQHGFTGSVALQPGDNSICAYAIGLSGNNPGLGCRTVRLSPPIGNIDLAVNAGGVANLAGWAFDPGAPGQSISVDVYVNGAGVRLAANQPRADVNAVMGVSGQHGFTGSVPLQSGVNSICMFAIGLVAGNNPLLGCRSVVVGAPVGSLDFAADAGGVANLSGWAFDPNVPDRSIPVDIYVNGSGVRWTADKARTDVNAVMGVIGQHGFSGSVPLRAGSNSVCAFGISSTGGGNTLLGCRDVQSAGPGAAVQQAAPQAATPALADPAAPATVVAQQPSSTPLTDAALTDAALTDAALTDSATGAAESGSPTPVAVPSATPASEAATPSGPVASAPAAASVAPATASSSGALTTAAAGSG